MIRTCLCVVFCLPVLVQAQTGMHDLLDGNANVVWFGLDFSQARLIGSEGFNDPASIKQEYFGKWNQLMVTEVDKFDWGKALQVPHMKYHIAVVNAINDKVNVRSLVINRSFNFSEGAIDSCIQRYTISDQINGIGVVVIVESLDKIREMGFAYITFFDISSRQILFTHRLIGEANGFGFRNYWAGAIYNWLKFTRSRVMKDIRKKFKHKR